MALGAMQRPDRFPRFGGPRADACSVLLNRHRRHCGRHNRAGAGVEKCVRGATGIRFQALLYQMVGSRQSVRVAVRQHRDGPREAECETSRAMMYSCVARPAVGPMTSALAALALAAIAGSAGAANDPNEGSRLPVPRFVSLKSDHVNEHGVPNRDHYVAGVYTRPGLPVEITAEYENWRRIRDWDGAEGWVYHSLLSGRRTAFVAKLKAASAPAALHE